MMMKRLLLAGCLVGMASGFSVLEGLKMPSLQGMVKAVENKEKFGDKKLVVITGTSSGVRPPAIAPDAKRSLSRLRPACRAASSARTSLCRALTLCGCHAGLGRATAKAMLRTGEYHVIGAVRDLDKV